MKCSLYFGVRYVTPQRALRRRARVPSRHFSVKIGSSQSFQKIKIIRKKFSMTRHTKKTATRARLFRFCSFQQVTPSTRGTHLCGQIAIARRLLSEALHVVWPARLAAHAKLVDRLDAIADFSAYGRGFRIAIKITTQYCIEGFLSGFFRLPSKVLSHLKSLTTAG